MPKGDADYSPNEVEQLPGMYRKMGFIRWTGGLLLLRVGEFMASFVLVAIFSSDLLSASNIRRGMPRGAISSGGCYVLYERIME